MSTSFGWGEGGNVTSAGWQITPCDPVWHVSSCSGEEATCQLLYSVYLLFLPVPNTGVLIQYRCEVDGPVTSTHLVVVAIDFGTTYSGYAFSFADSAPDRAGPPPIHMMRRWEGGDPGVVNQKTPTTILLTPTRPVTVARSHRLLTGIRIIERCSFVCV